MTAMVSTWSIEKKLFRDNERRKKIFESVVESGLFMGRRSAAGR